jgi:ABC-type multidrug transport system fused ATPase/permease subunit
MREVIAVVQQDCLLFDWTVRENIAFGHGGPDDEIERVSSTPGLSEVIGRHEEQGEPTQLAYGIALAIAAIYAEISQQRHPAFLP